MGCLSALEKEPLITGPEKDVFRGPRYVLNGSEQGSVGVGSGQDLSLVCPLVDQGQKEEG